jgi:ribose transport system ATP-binding protein
VNGENGARLEIRRLTKRFAGNAALDAVDFDLRGGEVHALLGENGAGKSTLIKILAGVHRPDDGEIRLDGRTVDPTSDKLPIAFIHQDLGLVDSMSVAENVAVIAGYPRHHGLISWAATRDAATAAVERMGGGVDPLARVGDLSAAEKSIVAIARAMAISSDILVLDEPTAALPEADVARLLGVLRRLRERGIGIIYVTHRLDEVFRIADRVTILRDGRRVASETIADTNPQNVVLHIVGRSLSSLFPAPPIRQSDIVLTVDALVANDVGPVSFTLAAGEILGLVGLRGAGHATVGRAVFGDIAISRGSLSLANAPFHASSPEEAIGRGVGFISSKRGEESLALNLSVRENLFMNPTIAGARILAMINVSAERKRCSTVLRQFSVRPMEPDRPVGTLSGGNQQKIVVARWLEAGSRLLVLEEPTFGVDVGAKAEIYQILRDALSYGLAVLLISSDFEEVAGISNRALIFDRGRVVAELTHEELSITRLTALAAGAEESSIQARLA